jgi:hypothetical protein
MQLKLALHEIPWQHGCRKPPHWQVRFEHLRLVPHCSTALKQQACPRLPQVEEQKRPFA